MSTKKDTQTELRTKHIDITQDVINRLAQNSFVIKGWSVTVVTAIVALVAIQDANRFVLLIAIIPAIMFWGLDAYYLRQERLFRELYKAICHDLNSPDEEKDLTPLDMDITKYKNKVHTWKRILFSKTVWPIPVIATVLILTYLIFVPATIQTASQVATLQPIATLLPSVQFTSTNLPTVSVTP